MPFLKAVGPNILSHPALVRPGLMSHDLVMGRESHELQMISQVQMGFPRWVLCSLGLLHSRTKCHFPTVVPVVAKQLPRRRHSWPSPQCMSKFSRCSILQAWRPKGSWLFHYAGKWHAFSVMDPDL
ncbi:B-cell CLL/lymphoma 9 protein [Manis javanica]|nr:B-cell CLL/lymphoma 9 protein [Manis javanica]